MARIRSIKPEIAHDAALSSCSYPARFLYVMLITQADDAGRLHGSAGAVRGACLPNDDVTLGEIDGWLAELQGHGLLDRYLVERQEYVALRGWSKNQRVDKPSRFVLPEPPPSRGFATPSRESRENGATPSRSDLGPTTPDPRPSIPDPLSPSISRPTPAAPDADSIEECEHLADLIERNGSKRPTVTAAWLLAADRLRRLDGRTHEQVMAAIDWCQGDEFWRANVLSMPKLREKYDQLRLAAQRSPQARAEDRTAARLAAADEIQRRLEETA